MKSRNQQEGRYAGYYRKHARVAMKMRQIEQLNIHLPQRAFAMIFFKRKNDAKPQQT